jgi:hypothetical protein
MDCMTPTLVDPSSSHSYPRKAPGHARAGKRRHVGLPFSLPPPIANEHNTQKKRLPYLAGPHDNVRGASRCTRMPLLSHMRCGTFAAAHERCCCGGFFTRRRQGDGHLRPRWDRGKRGGASETIAAKKGLKEKKNRVSFVLNVEPCLPARICVGAEQHTKLHPTRQWKASRSSNEIKSGGGAHSFLSARIWTCARCRARARIHQRFSPRRGRLNVLLSGPRRLSIGKRDSSCEAAPWVEARVALCGSLTCGLRTYVRVRNAIAIVSLQLGCFSSALEILAIADTICRSEPPTYNPPPPPAPAESWSLTRTTADI